MGMAKTIGVAVDGNRFIRFYYRPDCLVLSPEVFNYMCVLDVAADNDGFADIVGVGQRTPADALVWYFILRTD